MTTSIALPLAERTTSLIAFFALLLGAAALACGGVFLRQSELPPTASAVYRVALAIPVLFFFDIFSAKAERKQFPDRLQSSPVPLILIGFIFSGNLALYHWSMTLTTLANSNLLANLAPIFVVVGAKMFFHQKFKKGFIFGMVFALAGAVVLISARLDLGSSYMTGNLFGIVTAMFYGAYLLAVSRVRANFRTTSVMAWSSVGTFIVLLPITLMRGEPLIPHTLHGILVLLALALISHVGGQGLIAYALAKLPAALSSVTLLVQPVIATLLGWYLLHEYLRITEFIGGAIVLIGIMIARRHS